MTVEAKATQKPLSVLELALGLASLLFILGVCCYPFAILFLPSLPPSELSEAVARNPVWSPTGDYIVAECTFGGWEDPDWELCASAPDLSNLIRLNEGMLVDWSGSEAAWSPDGKEVAFQTGAALVIAAIPSGEMRYERAYCDYPAWSPDGKSIVCSNDGELLLEDPMSSHFRRLTQNSHDRASAWIDGGNAIAFIRRAGSVAFVYAIDASGGNERILSTTSRPSSDSLAASPDGQWLAFPMSDGTNLGLLEVQSSEFTPLLAAYEDCIEGVDKPQWSHNGQYIAFVAASRCHGHYRAEAAIWLLDVGTLDVVRLTPSFFEHSWDLGRPSWSPDDLTIVSSDENRGWGRLMLLPVADANCTPFDCD